MIIRDIIGFLFYTPIDNGRIVMKIIIYIHFNPVFSKNKLRATIPLVKNR